jgi:hypothetical protein
MAENRPESPWLRFRMPIHDLLGLVIGYGMAALFFRAFWPTQGLRSELITPAVGLYAWLGLAMSAPALLTRPRTMAIHGGEIGAIIPSGAERTGSEIAWLWIGIYWIALALFVIPSRMSDFQARDTALLAVLPSSAVILSRNLKPKWQPGLKPANPWTRNAAVGVLVTWPLAWICLMILGATIR